MVVHIDTSNETFRGIIGNGARYVVPPFQRDYSWQDILDLPVGDIHYMGYLVLQSENNLKKYHIIDGQQRLTTISILILSGLYLIQDMIEKNIDVENNQKRLDTLKNSYVGATDPVSLVTENKLTLNRNNHRYFANICALNKNLPQRKIKTSEKKLSDALVFFKDKMIRQLGTDSGERIAEFIGRIVYQFYFTIIRVDDDLNAYKIFETLNARGVQLSTPDLVKNYLFYLIDSTQQTLEQDLEKLDTEWEGILYQLEKNDFSDFLRAEWNSRHPTASKSNLFKKIKNAVQDRKQAFEYLQRHLYVAAPVYAALQNPVDELWSTQDTIEYRTQIHRSLHLLRLFHIKQPMGVLLSAYLKFPRSEFVKVLDYIETVSLRYNVIGNNLPAVQENVYNEIARRISDGTYSRASHLKESLKTIYIRDEEFIEAFSSKQLKLQQSDKKARYLLMRLERHVNPSCPIEDTDMSLEHIFPYHPSSDWYKDNPTKDLSNVVHRMGNLALLDKKANKDLGNKDFSVKTNMVAKYPTWQEDTIIERQRILAKYASKCWRIEF
jgi:hypothetical protein